MDGNLVEWTFERGVATSLDRVACGSLVEAGGAAALVTALLHDARGDPHRRKDQRA
jgi:hypothetical protein